MTLAIHGKSRRRKGVLALGAFVALALAIAVGLGAFNDTGVRATANPTQLNVSSSECVEGGVHFHFVAPHQDDGTGGSLSGTYTVNGGAETAFGPIAESTSNNSTNAQWDVTITGSGTFVIKTATSTGGDVYTGNGAEVATISCGQAPTVTHTVTVVKYVDGDLATSGTFNFTATWTAANLNGGATTSGSFSLSSGNGFSVPTSPMDAGAAYSVVENGIGGTCGPNDAYRLAGYSTGATLAAAAAASAGPSASFTNLQANMWVVVKNESCGNVGGTGAITIVKQGLANNDMARFSDTIPGGPDDFNLANGGSQTFEGLDAGTWTVTESALDGYTLTGASCVVSGSTTASTSSLSGRTLTITIADGQHVTCTFVNAQAENEGGEQLNVSSSECVEGGAYFHFVAPHVEDGSGGTLSGTYTVDGISHSFGPIVESTANNSSNAQWDVTITGSGTFVITSASSTGGAVYSGNGSEVATITCGEAVGDTGSITIVKEGLTGNATADFTDDITAGGTFSLGVTPNNSQTFEGLDAATYHFTEMQMTGWTLTSVSCSFDQANGALAPTVAVQNSVQVVLGAGEHITCTFVNAPAQTSETTHTVTVVKYVDGSLATSGSFGFTTNTTASNVAGCESGCTNPFTLSGPYQATTTAMAAGSMYSVAETAIDGTCDQGDTYRLMGYSTGATLAAAAAGSVGNSASFTNLQSDQFVVVWNQTCADLGSITIVKDFSPNSTATANFSATGTGVSGFGITEGTANGRTFGNLTAGDFTFTEGFMTGWMVNGVNCTGEVSSADFDFDLGGRSLTVHLAAGQDVTCTFTNNQIQAQPTTGSITISKVASPDLATSPTFTTTGTGLSGFSLTTGGTPAMAETTFSSLAPGAFTVVEGNLSGWALSSVACTTGGSGDSNTRTATINLVAGADVVCTFTNTQIPGSITNSDVIPPTNNVITPTSTIITPTNNVIPPVTNVVVPAPNNNVAGVIAPPPAGNVPVAGPQSSVAGVVAPRAVGAATPAPPQTGNGNSSTPGQLNWVLALSIVLMSGGAAVAGASMFRNR